jgi:hypothetical protein
MHSLEVIVALNQRAPARSSDRTHLNRTPSRCRSAKGLVLHSATLRSTVFFDYSKSDAKRDGQKVERAFRRFEKNQNLAALNRAVDAHF